MIKNFDTKRRNLNEGQAVIIVVLILLTIILGLTSSLSSPVIKELQNVKNLSESKSSYFLAEAGSEDIVYRIKNNMQVPSYATLSLNGGINTITVTDLGSGEKEIISSGDIKNNIRKIKNRVKISDGISFNYGLLVGEGGIDFDNNSRINGSVYSNGGIEGDFNVVITGDVYVAAQIASSTNQESIIQNDDFIFGKYLNGNKQVDAMQSFIPSGDEADLTKLNLYLKKVGTPSNLDIKITKDKNGEPDKNEVKASGTISSSLIGGTYDWINVTLNDNPEIEAEHTYWIVADANRDDDNYYVWGLDNTSGYVNGEAKYSEDWEGKSLNNINGDLAFKIWSSSGVGILKEVTVDDGLGGFFSVYANTIINSDVSGNVFSNSFTNGIVGGNIVTDTMTNCSILGNANYNVNNGCTVGGTSNSSTTPPDDVPPIAMPISQANIDDWKAEATVGGTISSGDYTPPEEINYIGPGVIYGDLNIDNNQEVFLQGTVYVTGNIDVENNASIKLDPAYGTASGILLSDGWAYIAENTVFDGSGSPGSYMMLLSLAVCDGTVGLPQCTDHEASIDVRNNVTGVIFAAPYGTIRLQNNITAKGLIGWRLKLDNNLVLDYEQGLSNINFSSGPSGSWSMEEWREIE